MENNIRENSYGRVSVYVESAYIHKITGKPIRNNFWNRLFRGRNIIPRPNRKKNLFFIPKFGVMSDEEESNV